MMRSNVHFRHITMMMMGWEEIIWEAGRKRDREHCCNHGKAKNGAAWRAIGLVEPDWTWAERSKRNRWIYVLWRLFYAPKHSQHWAFCLHGETSTSLLKARPLCTLLTSSALYSKSQWQNVFLKVKWYDPIWSSPRLLLNSSSLCLH